MANVGPGTAPNKQAATQKVAAQPGKKIFSSGGIKNSQPKAPSLKPGQTPKTTGK
jgi:hypothetical protein